MEIKMILGAPASGKSTLTKEYVNKGFISLNRDTEGGSIAGLLPKMEKLLQSKQKVVLDNTFPKIEIRKPFIELAKKYNYEIDCVWLNTSIEDAAFNAINRMISLTGKLLMPEEIKKSKHPNIFPPAVLFKYKKEFEAPTPSEGFSSVSLLAFERKDNPEFTCKALILDYDGTLRECINGNGKFPIEENQIEIKPNRTKILQEYKNKGYLLLGVSNQSGVHKGELTQEKAHQLFKKTNEMLGVDIDYAFCPHPTSPPNCYCRKPNVGYGVNFINKYKLNRKECIFIGDMTSDETFSKRCGFQYVDQAEFFK